MEALIKKILLYPNCGYYLWVLPFVYKLIFLGRAMLARLDLDAYDNDVRRTLDIFYKIWSAPENNFFYKSTQAKKLFFSSRPSVIIIHCCVPNKNYDSNEVSIFNLLICYM